jgi:hypothetical protein
VEDREAVIHALRAAGVDPTDFEHFVNRPNPAAGIEASTFDSAAAFRC